MLGINQKITVHGCRRATYAGNAAIDINASDIISELIKAAGTLCECYASDMWYELNKINGNIVDGCDDVLYIGIRSYGVDGNVFVESRLNKAGCNYDPSAYIRLYRLNMCNGDDGLYTMELERISAYTAEKEIHGKF